MRYFGRSAQPWVEGWAQRSPEPRAGVSPGLAAGSPVSCAASPCC